MDGFLTGGLFSPGGGGGDTVFVPQGGGAFRSSLGGPLILDLTQEFLAEQFMSPLVAGDFVTWEFTVLNEDGEEVDLTGASVVFNIYDEPASEDLILARAGVLAADPATGVFSVAFDDEDLEILQAAAGRQFYQCRITFGDSSVRTFLAGRIDVLRSH